MNQWQWIAVAVPAVVGVAGAAFLAGGRLANPAFYARIEADPLVALTGFALSTITALALAIHGRVQHMQHRTLKESMTQATEARHRFLRRLDHEMKNPLTGIRAGLANLGVTTDVQDRQDILSGIESQVVQLSRLVRNLRKLADLETRFLERLPVDMSNLLHEIVELSQGHPNAESRHLTLDVPVESAQDFTILGDRDLLSVALYNLLDNALKFTRQRDQIRVQAIRHEDVIKIQVTDTGPGIPESEMPHVWDELYRGQRAYGVPGSGIGLALVRAVVERHGGQVALRSHPDHETTFTVWLPSDGVSES